MSDTLFIYAKEGRIRCLTSDEAREAGERMTEAGYYHTATINPARWIERLANGETAPPDMLDELQFKPTNAKQWTNL